MNLWKVKTKIEINLLEQINKVTYLLDTKQQNNKTTKK